MDTLILILKTIGLILVTMVVSSTLIGLLIRDAYERYLSYMSVFSFMSILYVGLILLTCYFYSWYFDKSLALAFILLVVFRIPGLLDELKGREGNRRNIYSSILWFIPILIIINYYF